MRTQCIDGIGNTVRIGDKVAYRRTAAYMRHFETGIVGSFTAKKVRVGKYRQLVDDKQLLLVPAGLVT